MGSINFKLQLFKYSKVYPIFHALLLKPAPDSASLIKIIDYKKYKNQDYNIEKILVKKSINKKNYYLIKQKEYELKKNI